MVPANSARAFFQSGELLIHSGINYYQVSCEILINTVSETQQIIAPGLFNITAVTQNESPFVMGKTVQLAALDFNDQQYARGGSGSSSPVDIHRYYRFKLTARDSSGQSTLVRSLSCRGALDTPYQASLPTLSEMQATVGSFIKFNLR